MPLCLTRSSSSLFGRLECEQPEAIQNHQHHHAHVGEDGEGVTAQARERQPDEDEVGQDGERRVELDRGDRLPPQPDEKGHEFKPVVQARD